MSVHAIFIDARAERHFGLATGAVAIRPSAHVTKIDIASQVVDDCVSRTSISRAQFLGQAPFENAHASLPRKRAMNACTEPNLRVTAAAWRRPGHAPPSSSSRRSCCCCPAEIICRNAT